MSKKIKGYKRKNLKVEEVSLVDKPANPHSLFTLYKRDGESDTIDIIAGQDNIEKGTTGMNLEEMKKALEDAHAQIEELKKSNEELEKAKKEQMDKECGKTKKDDMEKALEGISEEMREMLQKRFETLEASNEALKKSSEEEMKKRIQIEQKLELEALAKSAEAEFPNLPGEPLQKAQMMLTLNSLPAEQKEYHLQLLKSANENIGKTFTPVGKSGESTVTDVQEKLTKIAEDIQKADSSLTNAQAYLKACKSPEGQKLVMEQSK